MDTRTVSTSDGTLLPALRECLGESDEAILAVAFVSEQGVHLIAKNLKRLGARARLLVTTAFGTTTDSSLSMASDCGVRVGVLNPRGSRTYHPKLYVSRAGSGASCALIGSVNLTGGLVNNLEVGAYLKGTRKDKPLRDAWALAERLWESVDTTPWMPTSIAEPAGFAPELYHLLQKAVATNPVFSTLGPNRRPNRVTELTPLGLYVETERTRAMGAGPQFIPSWMFELAWDYLRSNGTLTNRFLLDELHVHRSSAVCAILARLEPVGQIRGRSITLEWKGVA